MASRLMLSLKKAAANPKESWSLLVMADLSRGRPVEDGTVRLELGVPGELDGVPGVSILPNGEGPEPERSEASHGNNPSTPECFDIECRYDLIH